MNGLSFLRENTRILFSKLGIFDFQESLGGVDLFDDIGV
jgi:hypothetical protein